MATKKPTSTWMVYSSTDSRWTSETLLVVSIWLKKTTMKRTTTTGMIIEAMAIRYQSLFNICPSFWLCSVFLTTLPWRFFCWILGKVSAVLTLESTLLTLCSVLIYFGDDVFHSNCVFEEGLHIIRTSLDDLLTDSSLHSVLNLDCFWDIGLVTMWLDSSFCEIFSAFWFFWPFIGVCNAEETVVDCLDFFRECASNIYVLSLDNDNMYCAPPESAAKDTASCFGAFQTKASVMRVPIPETRNMMLTINMAEKHSMGLILGVLFVMFTTL